MALDMQSRGCRSNSCPLCCHVRLLKSCSYIHHLSSMPKTIEGSKISIKSLFCCFTICIEQTSYSFISGMHRYECIALNIDIILQRGRFWATSTASLRERFNDSRSCWEVFIHVVWGHPGGLLQFSKGEAIKVCLASDSSVISAMWQNMERCRAWTVAERCGCSVFCLTSLSTDFWQILKSCITLTSFRHTLVPSSHEVYEGQLGNALPDF